MSLLRGSGKDLLNVSKFVLPLGGASVLAVALGVGWVTQPDRLVRGYQPAQPVAYSHRLHAGSLRIPCQYCHTGARKSRVAGIPPVEKCMNCHRVTRTEAPDIRKLNAVYRSGEPLGWARVHALPDHVYFDHRPHVSGGVACQTCHGEVESMQVVRQVMSMRMSNCLACHRDPEGARSPRDAIVGRPGLAEGSEHCAACHR